MYVSLMCKTGMAWEHTEIPASFSFVLVPRTKMLRSSFSSVLVPQNKNASSLYELASGCQNQQLNNDIDETNQPTITLLSL